MIQCLFKTQRNRGLVFELQFYMASRNSHLFFFETDAIPILVLRRMNNRAVVEDEVQRRSNAWG